MVSSSGVAHQVADHVLDLRPLADLGRPRGPAGGVEAHRWPSNIPGSWYCSGMWSIWCHSR